MYRNFLVPTFSHKFTFQSIVSCKIIILMINMNTLTLISRRLIYRDELASYTKLMQNFPRFLLPVQTSTVMQIQDFPFFVSIENTSDQYGNDARARPNLELMTRSRGNDIAIRSAIRYPYP